MTTTLPCVAVITGGASGMGRACADRLGEDGHAIAVLDIDGAAAEETARHLRDRGTPALGLAVDVTSSAEVAAAAEQVTTELGTPSVLVNAAGVLRGTRFEDISEQEWDLVLDVSLRGTFLMSQAFVPHLRAAGGGRIVNFSSTAGKTASTLGGAHYTAAKSGILGLTRAMAKELASSAITVNAVCPGLIDTEMVRASMADEAIAAITSGFPVQRPGRPREVSALVAYLCSDDAAYITGAAIDINGGDLMV